MGFKCVSVNFMGIWYSFGLRGEGRDRAVEWSKDINSWPRLNLNYFDIFYTYNWNILRYKTVL